MKKLALIFVALAALLPAGALPLTAAESKPIAAFSVASYNELLADANFLGNLADRQNVGAMIDGFVSLATQFKGLSGVDKTRPFGAILLSNGDEMPTVLVCVPITDFRKVLDLAKLFDTVEDVGGVYKLTAKDDKAVNYVKEHGQWACFSDKAESLTNITVDPSGVLRGVQKDYVFAGRFFIANLPQALRDKGSKEGLAAFQDGFDGARQRAAREGKHMTAEQTAQLKRLGEKAASYYGRVVNDLDEISFGCGLDRKAEKAIFDLSITARRGTKTAEEMNLSLQSKTQFADFYAPDAAVTASIAGLMPESQQAIALDFLQGLRSSALTNIEREQPEEKRKAAKQLAGDSFDLATQIVKSGRIDFAMTQDFQPQSAIGLAALHVGDGPAFDKLLNTVVAQIEKEGHGADQNVKVDAANIGDLHVHTISIPIPENASNREAIVRHIGESLEVVIAAGKENAYLAAGRDAQTKLMAAIRASAAAGFAPAAPLKLSMNAAPIADGIASLAPSEQQKGALIAKKLLDETPDKDHQILSMESVANGIHVRLEVQQGLLRLLGRGVATGMERKTPEAAAQPSDGI